MLCVPQMHGGGGTSANMNLNEVLAARANVALGGSIESGAVHPNTHVNMSQSTNDVIPAAMCMCVQSALHQLADSLDSTAVVLGIKERELGTVIRLGRTCLQDALPMTFGQTFSSYRSQCERLSSRVRSVSHGLLALPLPATAIGTCLGSGGSKYRDLLYEHLHTVTGESGYTCEDNLFDALSSGDLWIQVSGAHVLCFCHTFTSPSQES